MPHLMRRAPSALVSMILALCIPVAAEARRAGIAGFSGNPATNGGATCNQCHSGGLAPSVDLTGPTIVAVGETRSYSLFISGGQEVACGLGVSAAVGTLAVVETGTRLREGEVTHTSKRFVNANGECLYGFDWTAPAFGGTFRLYAGGNSVNFDGQLTGDRATSVWLEIEVTGAPPINQPPIANAGGPYLAVRGEEIAFDGSRSLDSDGSVEQYLWDFGDGSTAAGPEPAHAYAAGGSYVASLTVTDDGGLTHEAQAEVTILAEPLRAHVEIVASGLEVPNFVTAPDGDPRLFVLEGLGRIRIVEAGVVLDPPFLDLEASTRFAGESGLLGLAFAPDYAESGTFYVNYVADDGAFGTITLVRYQVSGLPDLADADSGEILLEFGPHPHHNHYGGHLAFGPDGMLYMAIGDGGTFAGNELSQDDGVPYGKLLRIDVSGGPGSGYSVPSDNPFSAPGDPMDEIWAKGLRNPYRFSFDRENGDLYIGDVGAAKREEVDVEPVNGSGGHNYGWSIMEGTICRTGGPECGDGSLTLPIHEFTHDAGRCAIIGGYVYRGSVASLRGRYLFGDYCTGRIWALTWDGFEGIEDLIELTSALKPGGGSFGQIVGFGEDGFGELYVVDYGGKIFKIVDEGQAVPALHGVGLLALSALLAGVGGMLTRRRATAESGGVEGPAPGKAKPGDPSGGSPLPWAGLGRATVPDNDALCPSVRMEGAQRPLRRARPIS